MFGRRRGRQPAGGDRDARVEEFTREFEARSKSREFEARVESLRTALAPVLGLERSAVELAVPLEYADRSAGIEVDDRDELDDVDELGESAVESEGKSSLPPVRLVLPDHFQPAARASVGAVVEDRLGGQWSHQWRMEQYPHVVEMTRKLVVPRPPATCAWELSPDKYSIFVGRTGRGPVFVEMETETPHFGVSANTGGGKTTTLLLAAVHWRAHGALVDVIDMKIESYEHSLWGVSGFRVHVDTASGMMAMAEFLVSAMARSTAVQRGYPAESILPRVLLIDEFGSFVKYANIWWKTVLGNKGDPPLHDWLHVGLMQGRSKNHRFIVGTHDFSYRTFKGTNVRDLFGSKILLGPIPYPRWVETYGHGFKKVKHAAKRKGRGVIGITGTQPVEVQLAYLGEHEDIHTLVSGYDPAPAWYDAGEMAPWVTSEDVEMANNSVAIAAFLPGEELVAGASLRGAVPVSQRPSTPSIQGKQPGTALDQGQIEGVMERLVLVGMREALANGHLPRLMAEVEARNPDDSPADVLRKAHENLRKTSRRDPEFPEPSSQRGQEKLYLITDLTRWEENRSRRVNPDSQPLEE